MIELSCLQGSKSFLNLFRLRKYRKEFRKNHPTYFNPEGLLVFSGPQGSGKTLSAVKYVRELSWLYPKIVICSNVDIKGLNPLCKFVEYTGIECLTNLENGYEGIVYLIDEIHLEFNSLESKNIPIEVMVEVSQQRKQRKHIVGTTQQYFRLAKPFREQMNTLVLCAKIFNCIQYNKLVDGTKIKEDNGHFTSEVKKKMWFFHTPELYDSYDTYAKMRRYRKEWKGVSIKNSIYEGC